MHQKADNTLFRSISAAFLILIMHIVLLGSIGVLIFLFYGIVNHMAWIVLGITCLSAGGYLVIRRLKSDRNVLKNIAGGSLQGKTVEVSVLGGVANIKISDSQNSQVLMNGPAELPGQEVAPNPDNVKDLTELARLYENRLITLEEYNKAKQSLFR